MSRNLLFFSFLALVVACTPAGLEPNVTLRGDFPSAAGAWVYLEEMEPLQTLGVDSVETDERGEFSFELHVPQAGFYLLRSEGGDFIVLLLEPGEEVALRSATGRIDLTTEAAGSPGTNHLLEFERFMDHQRRRIDSLAQVYNERRGEPGFMELKGKLDSLYLTYFDEQRARVFRFIDRHPGSLASLLMLNRKLGQAEVIDEEEDFIYLHRVDSLLQLSYPDNKHTADHHRRVKAIRARIFDNYVLEEKLRPGKPAPDVVLNDTSGNPVSLKSYTGRRVILYFWAGWDARSRMVNRRLVDLYPGIRESNTEILGISLDENAVVWKGAIRLDRLAWAQVSDLKGIYSPVAEAYHIRDRLPCFYLIDAEQKIAFKHEVLDSILVRLN